MIKSTHRTRIFIGLHSTYLYLYFSHHRKAFLYFFHFTIRVQMNNILISECYFNLLALHED